MGHPETDPPQPGGDERPALAVAVARLYYHQGLTSEAVAQELGLSRPKVSRLLSFARRTGLVEIRIHDDAAQPQALEARLQARYPGLRAQVVGVPPGSGEPLWLERVAAAAAATFGALLRPGLVVGLAWGNTLEEISKVLTPRAVAQLTFVQLNGSANAADLMNGFVSDTLLRFARSYGAQTQLFPVPTFFDDPATKQAMWRERSVQHVLELQERADLLLYSVGSVGARVPSHVYTGGYLSREELEQLTIQGVAGDIATVFYRADGSYGGLPMNARASGPDLSLMQSGRTPAGGERQRLCVVSGLGKVEALRAALEGRLLGQLIVDERTAAALLETEAAQGGGATQGEGAAQAE